MRNQFFISERKVQSSKLKSKVKAFYKELTKLGSITAKIMRS